MHVYSSKWKLPSAVFIGSGVRQGWVCLPMFDAEILGSFRFEQEAQFLALEGYRHSQQYSISGPTVGMASIAVSAAWMPMVLRWSWRFSALDAQLQCCSVLLLANVSGKESASLAACHVA